MQEYTIDKISWHSRLDNSPEFQSRLRRRFLTVSRFLESHGLWKDSVDLSPIERGEDFSIHSSHLTSTGLELMKKAYPKWLKSLDRGADPEATKILDNELAKLTKST